MTAPISQARRLHRSIFAPFRRHGALLPLAIAVAMAGRTTVPLAVRYALGENLRHSTQMAVLFGATLGAVLATGVSGYLMNVWVFQAAEQTLEALRTAAFSHIHRIPVLDRERRGELVANVTSDIDAASVFLQSGGLTIVLSSGQVLILTVLMAIYSWQLTLLFWGLLLVVALSLWGAQQRVGRTFRQEREEIAQMFGVMSETLVGTEAIHSSGAHHYARTRVDGTIATYARTASRTTRLSTNVFSAAMFASGIVLLAVIGGGTWLGVSGRLDLGAMLAFLFLMQLTMGPLQVIAESMGLLQNAVAGWRRVMALLAIPVECTSHGEAAIDVSRGPAEIRLEHVAFAYPGRTATLRDLNLTIPPGCHVAIVGPTGSGKTTLGKLLTGLLVPAQGRITIDGVDLRRVRPSTLRDRIAFVPQEGFLFDGSVIENILWGRPQAEYTHVIDTLAQLGMLDWALSLPKGLDTLVGQRGEHLSAGERQLVALARTVLVEPDVLVLDEATSDIDDDAEVRLTTALNAIAPGRTRVTIAHRLTSVESADLIVIVDGGCIVETGTLQEIIDRGTAVERNDRHRQLPLHGVGRSLLGCLMRPVAVPVVDEGVHDDTQVRLVHDENPVGGHCQTDGGEPGLS